jgi:pimeloyl-ACP methyl ester carboxylesterase
MTRPTWITSADGAQIAAYDFGGDGPPVLFAHATGFHAHAWLPVISRLRDGFHCYAFDGRGHGASPTPVSGDFSWHRFGDDARAVASALGLGRPRAVGHSGGGAALLLAEQDHPGTWDALWLFEPVVFEQPPQPPNPIAASALKRRRRFESHQAAIDNFASKPPFDVFSEDALTLYVTHGFIDDGAGGVTLACRPEDEAATYGGALTRDTWEGLARITVPVHLACGAVSTHLPAPTLAAAVARLPRGELEVMDGLGHFAPFEDPARVAASIRATFGLTAAR